ncbi:MAG TPA: hypothetical protein VF234_10700 [Limnochordia bacterium]
MAEGQSLFKGAIPSGRITAVFLSDFSNQDADLLVAAYASLADGIRRVDHNASAPGGRAEVNIDAPENGVLEVWVAIGAASDSGRLQIFHEGELRDDEAIFGSVRWVYSVEA